VSVLFGYREYDWAVGRWLVVLGTVYMACWRMGLGKMESKKRWFCCGDGVLDGYMDIYKWDRYPWDIRIGHCNWRLLAILKDFSYLSSIDLELDVRLELNYSCHPSLYSLPAH
jgi:hypothetical protein